MGRFEERALAGRGFAVFSQHDAFLASRLMSYFAADDGARHLVLITHKSTSESLIKRIRNTSRLVGAELLCAPWEELGDPDLVLRIGALPSEGLVIVSADHHLTVRDRLDPRRAYVRRQAARKKVVLDSIPYEVHPWRTFFPFAFFDRDLLGYHHSYALEQDYEKHLDDPANPNPCKAERLARLTWRAVEVDGAPRFAERPAIEVIAADAADHAAYAVERDRLFDTEKTIAQVKAKLSRWIQARYPTRLVPLDLKRVYEPGFVRLVATDLPFDRWLVGEITGLMDHTDELLHRWAELTHEADQ